MQKKNITMPLNAATKSMNVVHSAAIGPDVSVAVAANNSRQHETNETFGLHIFKYTMFQCNVCCLNLIKSGSCLYFFKLIAQNFTSNLQRVYNIYIYEDFGSYSRLQTDRKHEEKQNSSHAANYRMRLSNLKATRAFSHAG